MNVMYTPFIPAPAWITCIALKVVHYIFKGPGHTYCMWKVFLTCWCCLIQLHFSNVCNSQGSLLRMGVLMTSPEVSLKFANRSIDLVPSSADSSSLWATHQIGASRGHRCFTLIATLLLFPIITAEANHPKVLLCQADISQTNKHGVKYAMAVN